MPDKMILGIDPGTHTGWCLMKNGKVYESGTMDFSKKPSESNGMLFLKFRNWLGRILDLPGIQMVCYENTFSKSKAATEILANLRGRIMEECATRQINFTGPSPSTVKKWATGKGNADKGQMMARSEAFLGREPIDDNESDAVLIAAYAWEEFGE